MPNIKLQDLTAIVHGTSRYNGNQFDSVHVEILLQTDVPLTPEDMWYIPNGSSIPPEVLDFFRISNISMYPMKANEITAGAEDIATQADSGNLKEVMSDAAKYMLKAVMKKTSFTPVSGTNNLYMLSYDYKLYPMKEASNYFEFKVVLPFSGLGMLNGANNSKVQMTVIMPIASKIDPNATKGIAVNGVEVNELVKPMENVNRNILSFEYHQDPLFTIRYYY
jgi:hypothetical protein